MLQENKNLISISTLSKEFVLGLINRADYFLSHNLPKTDILSGNTLFNIFLENSTRTRASFELAAKKMGMDVVNILADSSSIKKGESLQDTVNAANSMGANAIVIRQPHSGILYGIESQCPIINGGDGAHQHPTQALLDALTIKNSGKTFAGLNVSIIGDILHSRVARSNIMLLTMLGANIKIYGPPTLVLSGFADTNVSIAENMESALDNADVVMILRVQKERMSAYFIPSTDDYHAVYGLKEQHLRLMKNDTVIMHPGPVNWGTEISSYFEHNQHQTLIQNQVQAGVAMRMAVLEKFTVY